MSKGLYLLLTSASVPLAKGRMLSPPGAENILVQVLDGKEGDVAEHEVIQMIGMDRGDPSLQCHLQRQRGDRFELKRMTILNPELRRALRIPVKFDSYLYPLSGGWKGRCAVRSMDLSCGGVAFFTTQELEVGEQAEIVIPITSSPVIMRAQVLRKQELKNGRIYYATKFVDMCPDEEQMVCEAVFSIQLQNRPRTAETEERKD